MTDVQNRLLAHAQRDARDAALLHALLSIALIVLWVTQLRLRFLDSLEATLVQLIFGVS